MFRILNVFFLVGFICIYVLIFLSSLKVTYSNLKFFNIIRIGKVIGVEYYNTLNADLKGTYTNVIIEDKTKDTIYGSTQKMYRVGDKVKFRYIGEQGGNVIFEVNNNIIGSKYDSWDVLSPFIILLFSYVFFRFVKNKILK
ncbi:Probable transmembrane hypothetical protein [Tenacibaculum maritimum]|uniref:hypothetical protein n=1 Tax=Tenacibaculum maritimum TaxID=107401 RepID=UPI0012E6A8E0|nr:hypothetical protein [Tenacibaculum maritimum]CAA0243872.1 Probable transmembrane hypothetical protein [Tenacibaculum maritimum]